MNFDNNFYPGGNHNYSKVVDINKEKMTKIFKLGFTVFLAIIAVLILFNSFTFRVDEREQVVVTQFDKIIRIVVDDKNDPSIIAMKENPKYKNIRIDEGKGLFFKIPFIQKTEAFTNQLLTYDTDPEEVFTLDKKTIVLDNFAQWKIYNPALFMLYIGNKGIAHQRIDENIYSKMREEIGRIEAHSLVADKDYVFAMLKRVKKYVNEQLEPTGIKVMDIRIKRTEYPPETYQNIFEQMRSERQAVATEYRSNGQKEARKIRSEAEKQATIIEAKAYEESQKIRGEGDATALQIYAEAYNQDPEFYQFWETLKTYKSIIDKDTVIVITPDSELAKYLYGK